MPLYALDDQNRVISAQDAQPSLAYYCLECRSLMQKRTGRERRAHFYHIRTTRACRLYGRSSGHIEMQEILQQQIPALEIEEPFPKISRIADLCWKDRRLIFEIQCSPISASESEGRMRDYALEGYELVWLLDDRLYNKRHLRAIELLLRSTCCYFFSLKNRLIYDQFELLNDAIRTERGISLAVDLRYPHPMPTKDLIPALKQLQNRKSSFFFAGDLLDRTLRHPCAATRLLEREAAFLSRQISQNKRPSLWRKIFFRGLEALLRRFSENGGENTPK